ncbi:MAG: Phosphoribosyl-ATP pyrophosphatase [Alphaproteobacteria bacterium MarineAlpha6_Bin4]|nr:MAG: Phosphoribosyl-ATP pyrophosphatase [Alphaproteobacteria bacterium MarineAlpha6_Bin3]PPR38399.1 MAG: Phosphoribosyl-ATP pyrophosphatase [Alphaproteobacteria bacterium MarineAlpha6_Bin4]|tara:strand:+ start:9136 stop:9459 length:324 start_codon:yes stop_codon:yes gene_type:complete
MNNKRTGEIIDTLFKLIEERKKSKSKGSYTSFLFNKGMNKIAQKVSEETAETIIEAVQGKKKLAVQESCDLLYHLIVMWAKLGVKPDEIWNELDKRMKKPKIKRKKI